MTASSYLLTGGSVYTMDPAQPWAQCVVVREQVITYVGSDAGAAPFIDPDTASIDVAQGMVLPGFIDAHDHLGAGSTVGSA